jgi:DNA-binding FrmR family transcriptional regulator
LTYTPGGIIILVDLMCLESEMPKKGPSTIDERLRRIEGQVRGVEKMFNEGAEVSKLVIQIQAITSSLESVRTELVKKEIKERLLSNIDEAMDLIR